MGDATAMLSPTPALVFDPRKVPVRWSHLKNMARSPLHYLHALTEERKMTPAMQFGKLVHKHLLGGEDVVLFEGDRRGNVWKDFRAANDGKWIATRDEYDRSKRCAEALAKHPLGANIVVGNLEYEIDWRIGGPDGRRAQSHVDALGFTWVSELKTAASASPSWFRWQAIKMGYHAQLAFYIDAATAIGRRIDTAHIACVEAKAPHAVTVFTLTPRAIEDGRRLNRLWLEQLRVCEESNTWPAYCQSAVELDTADAGELTLLVDGEEIAA